MLITRETADNYLQLPQAGICLKSRKSIKTRNKNTLKHYVVGDISKYLENLETCEMEISFAFLLLHPKQAF